MLTVENIKPGMGKVPAIALFNPKYAHNVAAATRAASCYKFGQVWFTGDRVMHDIENNKGGRMPREERMRGYQEVEVIHGDYFFNAFERHVTPIAVELVPGSESLITFEHPENALYVFGPEDGSLPPVTLRNCHRFVSIPTRHCTNLAAAVYTVLYDRHAKRVAAGLEDEHGLVEERGFIEPDHMSGEVGLV